MSLKIPNVGELVILDQLRGAWGNTLILHLYQNNYSPVDGSVIGSFTEATFSGYATQTCASWSAAATVSGRASTSATARTFTNSTGSVGNSIYGYYVTDGSGNLMWAEADPSAPVGMNNPGDSYTVTPTFTFATEF